MVHRTRNGTPFTNATILSGNIGDPGDSTDNSKSIITMEGVPDSVTIDGFTIRDGYANAKGIVLGNAGGAGLDMYKSIAVIRNCQFLNNHGALNGGAILLYYQDSCFISKTVFSNNSAPDFGGAISGTGGMLFLNGCVFIGNHSYGEGGAIQLGGFDLRNCVFYKNYTTAATNAAGTRRRPRGLAGKWLDHKLHLCRQQRGLSGLRRRRHPSVKPGWPWSTHKELHLL